MIIINQLNIDVTATNIVLDVATNPGNVFTSMLIWTSDTYKVTSSAIDLTSLLAAVDETEVLTIPATALGLTTLNGLFFIELQTDEPIPVDACCDDINIRLATFSNFIQYHECVLNNLLSLEIDGCGIKASDCGDCGDCSNKAIDAQLYLDGLYMAIIQGFYTEAIEIIKILDTLCKVCRNCPDYGEKKVLAGGGFGVYNNAITML